ncbi:hypothetical protein RN001_006754 [Aquatica leii]|uniref:Fidgetin-like protein 1 n=1 Tax=Aquatica leii TaxID=1421715 RepID=A0AAN7P8L0_9COLE|nr:hypothetical protein RN001_006754 [Aquatica leii]
MDPVENLNYSTQYEQLLFEKDKNLADVKRQCLVQTFSASLKLLNNEEALDLLEVNLDDYTGTLNRDRIDEKTLDKRSCLDAVDVSTLLCKCEKTSCFTQESFQTWAFFENKPDFSKNNVRTIAKRFAPRTCMPKNEKANVNDLPTLPESGAKQICSFKTAREELYLQNLKQGISSTGSTSTSYIPTGGQKRKLGYRRSVHSKFVSPMLSNSGSNEKLPNSGEWPTDEIVDERLKNIDPKMIELIKSEIMDNGPDILWDDIAGLESPKTAIQEAVVWPLLRPDIFTGLRKPPKGILLFGPPGTGKTLIGKCVASQSKSTFFSISASSLTSKWIGEGEKMVRALFAVAACNQPAVIFIDEVDSLLSQRSETEHESSRRLKTEFLIRLDGATSGNEDRVLVIGATNRPQELDEAARRRFVKRLYIPLPESEARFQIVHKLISKERNNLTDEDMYKIAQLSDGYSGADMKQLCSEASLGPIRSISLNQMETIDANEVRPVGMEDFIKALSLVRSSVSPKDLHQYIEWNQVYGSGCVM